MLAPVASNASMCAGRDSAVRRARQPYGDSRRRIAPRRPLESSVGGPHKPGTVGLVIARDAGRAGAPPPPPPPPGPSFLRTHPLLAGFGVLAALSLFAAYWPLSAIITGVVIAARATGADRAALHIVKRSARRLLDGLRQHGGRDRDPEGGAPDPAAPAPDPSATAPQPPQPSPPSPVAPEPAPAPGREAPPASRQRRNRAAARRSVESPPPAGIELGG